jgi:hypothetical protein
VYELPVDAKAAVAVFPNDCHSNKRALYIAVMLFLIRCGAANGQSAVSATCGDDDFASAEKLRREGSPEAHAKALEVYQRALRCNHEPAPSLKAAEILLNIGRMSS